MRVPQVATIARAPAVREFALPFGIWPIGMFVSVTLVFSLFNAGWAFTDSSFVDPWYYFGYLHFLPQYLHSFPQLYYGSRLPWLLPGFFAYSVLPPVVANYVLHVTYLLGAVTMLYLLVARTLSWRAAIVSSLLMLTYTPLLQAAGWDYADGPGILFVLVTLWLAMGAARHTADRRWLIGLGAAAALVVYSNLFWVSLLPAVAVYYLVLTRDLRRDSLVRAFAASVSGGIVVTIIFMAANVAVGGQPLFFLPSIKTAGVIVRDGNSWMSPGWFVWLPTAIHLVFPALWLLRVVFVLFEQRRKHLRPDAYADAFRWAFLTLFGILFAWQLFGDATLQLHYYASFLIPFVFLSVAAELKQPLQKLTTAGFALVAAAAAVLPVLPFTSALSGRAAAWQTGDATAAFLVLAGGLFLFTVVRPPLLAIGLLVVAWSVANVGVTDHRVIDLQQRHDKVMEFQAIEDATRAIAASNEPGSTRVWYDQRSALANVFEATAATQLAGFRFLDRSFPTASEPERFRGGRVALLSEDSGGATVGQQTLQSAGLHSTVVAQVPIQRGAVRFVVTTLALE